MESNTKKCPYCAGEIHIDALKCKHCREILDDDLRATREAKTQNQPHVVVHTERVISNQERKWSPGIAALLSFILPGAGQMYKGNVVSGIFWFIITIIAYFMLIIPGIILHLICIIAASSGNPYKD